MKEAHNCLGEILEIIDKVRIECPWVRKRTVDEHVKTIKEELAEVEQAIENKDYENLSEELGDLLWDVLLLMRICKDEKKIDIKHTLTILKEKMIRRRPYIYGNEKAETPEEVLAIWNRIKKEEKLLASRSKSV